MGLLDRFRKPEDPKEKTFHEELEKNATLVRRRSFEEGYLKGVSIREKERGKMAAINPQPSGILGNLGKSFDKLNINTDNVLFDGRSSGKKRRSPADSPFE